MKLKLSNFKCYKDKIFDFPDNGLILISGKSGSGKTTILTAIYFVLFGDVKKPITLNEKKCNVIFEHNNIIIKRYKSPNRLIVIFNDIEYENDIAQEFINNKYGTINDFLISSYIKQKNHSCILTQTPQQKLEFIEKLTFINKNIDNSQIKKKISEHIKVVSDNINKYNIELNYINDNLIQQISINFNDIKITNDNIQDYYKYINEKKQELTEIQISLKNQKDKIDTYNDIFKKYKKSYLIEYINNHDHIISYEHEKQLFKKFKEKYDKQVNDTYSMIDISQHDTKIKELEQVIKFIEYININCKFNYLKISDIDIDTFGYNKRYNCPHCNKSIIINNDKLYITTNNIINKVTQSTYNNIINYYNDIKGYDHLFNVNIDKLIKIKNKLNNDVANNKKYEEYKYYNKYIIDLYNDIKTQYKCNDIYNDIDLIQWKRNLLKIKKSLPLQYKINDISDLKLYYDSNIKLENEMKDIDINLVTDEYNKQLKIYDTRYKQYKNDKNICIEKYKHNIELIEKQQNDIINITDKLSILKNELNILSKLKEIIHKAEVLSMNDTIILLNNSINSYLNIMFSNDINITINNTVEKKGIVKFKITNNIIYKGCEYDSISDLSGGEFDRCVLSIMIACSNIMNSNILMLDESLASLDSDLCSDILYKLKKISIDKLILVVNHQVINGLFDDIITI